MKKKKVYLSFHATISLVKRPGDIKGDIQAQQNGSQNPESHLFPVDDNVRAVGPDQRWELIQVRIRF